MYRVPRTDVVVDVDFHTITLMMMMGVGRLRVLGVL